MQGTTVTGCITHPRVFDGWASIGQDHAAYLTHIEMAQSNKSDIDKVFCLMAGAETTYVSPDFDTCLWDAHASSVTVQTCTPEDIHQVYAAVRCTLGCN